MPAARSIRSFAGSRAGDNGPPSPTLTATTHASLDFPHRPSLLVTRADLRASVQAYEHVLQTCKAYTNAMLVLSRASADFAGALGECSKVKGAHEEADKLQACSGLHYLMSSYSQVLADTFWKDFQIPLLESFDAYRQTCNERQLLHEKQILEKSRILKETETKNMKLGSSKRKGEQGRDLNSFRRALAELQRQVDDLDELKADYYHEVLDAEQEMWEFIQSKVSLMVRSQLEISDRISGKGLSDPILEPILSSIPDPFGSYGPPKTEDQIFSILPPTSLLGGAGTATLDMMGSSVTSIDAEDKENGETAHTSTEGGPTRSHSLFGTLNYEDGKEHDDDDGFLASASASSAPITAATGREGKPSATAKDLNGTNKRAASNGGSAGDRAKHTLSIIREDASPGVAATLPSGSSSDDDEPADQTQIKDAEASDKSQETQTGHASAPELKSPEATIPAPPIKDVEEVEGSHSKQSSTHDPGDSANTSTTHTSEDTSPEQDKA